MLQLHWLLASHLAEHLRNRLETKKGYTATVGISTNKLLAKLVGNLHKPNGQTTLLPPYTYVDDTAGDNVTSFIDDHEVGKIPGIGFKIAQKLRAHVLQRPAEFDAGLVYGGTKEMVLVRDVRQHPGMGPDTLERLLGGPGAPHGIGARVWELINGCDSTEVGQAREVPTQISIEDSYLRLDTIGEVIKQLQKLATNLLRRMHADLLEEDEETEEQAQYGLSNPTVPKRWLAHPKVVRLSTRPRPPQNPDGSRNRSFARISKSTPMPGFVFSLKHSFEPMAQRLVNETLLPLFRQLHPEKTGWNLSLVNVAATNMADAASEKGGVGRDIAKMFKRQDDVLKQWRVEEEDEVTAKEKEEATEKTINDGIVEKQDVEAGIVPTIGLPPRHSMLPHLLSDINGSEDFPTPSQEQDVPAIDEWEYEDEDMIDADSYQCIKCGARMPFFAQGAHERYHAQSKSDM